MKAFGADKPHKIFKVLLCLLETRLNYPEGDQTIADKGYLWLPPDFTKALAI